MNQLALNTVLTMSSADIAELTKLLSYRLNLPLKLSTDGKSSKIKQHSQYSVKTHQRTVAHYWRWLQA